MSTVYIVMCRPYGYQHFEEYSGVEWTDPGDAHEEKWSAECDGEIEACYIKEVTRV